MPITGSTIGWDGSAAADDAVRWAAARAARRGGGLLLVRVLDSAASAGEPALAVRQVRRALEEETAVLSDRYPGVDVHAEIRVGDPGTELSAASKGGVLVIGGPAGDLDASPESLPLVLANRGEGATVIVPARRVAPRRGVVALLRSGASSIGTAVFAAQEAVESREPLILVRLADAADPGESAGPGSLRGEREAVQGRFPGLQVTVGRPWVMGPSTPLPGSGRATLLVLEARGAGRPPPYAVERGVVSRATGPFAVVAGPLPGPAPGRAGDLGAVRPLVS